MRRGGRCGGLRNHSEGEWLTGSADAKEWGGCWGREEEGEARSDPAKPEPLLKGKGGLEMV